MKKKIIRGLLLTSIAFLSLTACKKNNNETKPTTTNSDIVTTTNDNANTDNRYVYNDENQLIEEYVYNSTLKDYVITRKIMARYSTGELRDEIFYYYDTYNDEYLVSYELRYNYEKNGDELMKTKTEYDYANNKVTEYVDYYKKGVLNISREWEVYDGKQVLRATYGNINPQEYTHCSSFVRGYGDVKKVEDGGYCFNIVLAVYYDYENDFVLSDICYYKNNITEGTCEYYKIKEDYLNDSTAYNFETGVVDETKFEKIKDKDSITYVIRSAIIE